MICSDGYCEKEKTFIFSHLLPKADGYPNHLRNVKEQVSQDQTLNDENDQLKSHHARMNLKRMSRWDKVLEIEPDFSEYLESIDVSLTFLVISEAWCGDAAHVLPLMNKMSNLNPSFSLKILLRDEHPELMNAYLTNGNKSIPIVIVLKNKGGIEKELFHWGPCPEKITDLKKKYKLGEIFNNQDELLEAIHSWYNNDKSVSMQRELFSLFKQST